VPPVPTVLKTQFARSRREECSVNFGAELASVTYDPKKTDLAIQDAVDAAGYQPVQEQDLLTGDDDSERKARLAQNRGS